MTMTVAPRFVSRRRLLNMAPTTALSFSSPWLNAAKVSKINTGFFIFRTMSGSSFDSGYGGSRGSPFSSFDHKPQYIRFFEGSKTFDSFLCDEEWIVPVQVKDFVTGFGH